MVSSRSISGLSQKTTRGKPEEGVRQYLLTQMVEELGYPSSLLAIEKELKELPHLAHFHGIVPKRRIDILAFDCELLSPLLLIECKSERVDEKGMFQLLGYNAFVQARAVCLASAEALLLGIKKGDNYVYEWPKILPSFSLLKDLTCL